MAFHSLLFLYNSLLLWSTCIPPRTEFCRSSSSKCHECNSLLTMYGFFFYITTCLCFVLCLVSSLIPSFIISPHASRLLSSVSRLPVDNSYPVFPRVLGEVLCPVSCTRVYLAVCFPCLFFWFLTVFLVSWLS